MTNAILSAATVNAEIAWRLVRFPLVSALRLTTQLLALTRIVRVLRHGWLAVLAGLALLSAHAAQAKPAPSDNPMIVFVHGAFMDGNAWAPLRGAMEAAGYRTTAVDLPGRPANPAEPSQMSLTVYRDAVLAAIATQPRPVVLVGHSFGGLTISAVAEAAPDKIAALIYVAAYLPRDGQSLQALAGADRDSQTAASFEVDPARQVASITPAARAALFCNDCVPSDAEAAAAQMVSEPLPPLGDPVTLGASFAAVPKIYVRTALDLVISPSQQDRMIAGSPDVQVEPIAAGHLPMVSQTQALATRLDKLVQNLSIAPKE